MPVLEMGLYLVLMSLVCPAIGMDEAPDLKVALSIALGLVVLRQAVTGFLKGMEEGKAQAKAKPEDGPKKLGRLS